MNLIRKALKCKRYYQYLILIFIILSTLFCIQKFVILNLRNASILESAAKIDAYHTAIYIESKDGLPESYLNEYFKRINKENHDQIIDAYTMNYYDEISPEFENNFNNSEICYLEGFNNNKFDKFEVIHGKKISDLRGNEIAVNIHYWKFLQKKGFKLGDSLYNKNKMYFKITSVFDDPLIYMDTTSTFQESFLSQDNSKVLKFRAIGNQYYIKKNAFINKMQDGYLKVLFKIKVHNYSVVNESKFLTLVRANYRRDMKYNFQPLYFQLQKESVPYQSYKLISGILFISVLITNLFIFISIFKKRLEEKQGVIMCMINQGIKKKAILLYYAKELILLLTISLISLPFMNWIILNLFDKYNEINVFFGSSQISLIYLFICSILMYIIMLSILIREYNKFINQNKKIRNTQIMRLFKLTYIKLESYLSMKELFAYPFRYLRFIISCAILIGCLSLCVFSFNFITGLYNHNSIGFKYDFILGNMTKTQFNTIKKKYIKDMAAFSIQEKYFKEKVGEFDNLDIDRYYKALLLLFYEDIKPFVKIEKGMYPEAEHDARFYNDLEDTSSFLPRNCLTTKKIIDLKEGVIDESLPVNYNKKAIGYANSSYETWNGENFMFMSGTTNSLINGGYVTFANVGSKISLKERITNKNKPASIIINLKKHISKTEFQSYLEKEGISFNSYDNLIKEMSSENERLNEKLIIIALFIIFITASTFFILVFTFLVEDKMRMLETKEFLKRIGMKSSVVIGYRRLRYFIILIFILLLSISTILIASIGLWFIISKIFSVYKINGLNPIKIIILLLTSTIFTFVSLCSYQFSLKKNRIK